jgi:hypothetical protein
VSSTPRFVLVYTAATIPEAMAARGLLESQGLLVETKGELDGPYRFGPIYLFVPDDVKDEAHRLLEELSVEAPEVPEPPEE